MNILICIQYLTFLFSHFLFMSYSKGSRLYLLYFKWN